MNKNVKMLISTLFILFVLFVLGQSDVYADDRLAFEKDEFVFNEYAEDTFLHMIMPEGYTLSDLNFDIEDTDVATISVTDEEWLPYEYRVALRSNKPGETNVRVTIDNTDYAAQCRVKVVNPITISFNKGESKTVVSIQNKCAGFFVDTEYQAVELKVVSLDDNTESNWIQLGVDRFGGALAKTYTYELENNKDYKIMVRWVRGSSRDAEIWSEMNVQNEVVIHGDKPLTNSKIKIISENDKSELKVGGKVNLSVNFIEMPETEIKWESSDKTIATVDETGKVTGIAKGKATIKATANSCTDEYEVTIVEEKQSSIKGKIKILSENNINTIEIGEELKLSVKFIELTNQDIVWESSDSTIARIDSNGKIIALKEGTIKIIAHTADKEFSDEYKITVKKTSSNKDLPQTGKFHQVMYSIIIISFISICIICFKKYKKIF